MNDCHWYINAAPGCFVPDETMGLATNSQVENVLNQLSFEMDVPRAEINWEMAEAIWGDSIK